MSTLCEQITLSVNQPQGLKVIVMIQQLPKNTRWMLSLCAVGEGIASIPILTINGECPAKDQELSIT